MDWSTDVITDLSIAKGLLMFAIWGAGRRERNIWGYFQRPESGIALGCYFMGLIVSPRPGRIFITDICGQMVANAGVRLGFI